MLERMREFSKSWIMKGLLGLVALSFVAYFGAAPFQKQQQERRITAVKVNQQIITTQEFYRVYNQYRQELERNQGWSLDSEQQQEAAQTALDALIDRALIEQWFQGSGLTVTDDEVRQRLENFFAQLAPGQPVTPELYAMFLRNAGFESPAALENEVRRQLIREKVEAIVVHQVKVSEAELRDAFARRHRRVKVQVVEFLPENYMDQVDVTPEQIAQFYDTHQEKYRRPEQVNVDYIRINPADLQDEVTISDTRLEQFFNRNREKYQTEEKYSADYIKFDAGQTAEDIIPGEEEIQQYYDEHPDRYTIPERVQVRYIAIAIQDATGVNAPTDPQLRNKYTDLQDELTQIEASQIVLPVASHADNAQVEQVRREALRIRSEIEQGKDFAEAARQYSRDPTAEQGGSLGFVKRGQLPKPLEEALFSLGVRQISAPVRGPAGYYLLKVQNKHVPPMDEVRERLARAYAQELLEKVAEGIKASGVFPTGMFQGLQVLQTDFFERGQYIDDVIGADFYAFGNAAFRLSDGQTSNIIFGMKNFYLVHRVATQEPRRKSLEEARQDVIKDIRTDKLPQLARERAEDALRQMQNEQLTFEELAARYGLEVQNTGYFGLRDPLPALGRIPSHSSWRRFAWVKVRSAKLLCWGTRHSCCAAGLD